MVPPGLYSETEPELCPWGLYLGGGGGEGLCGIRKNSVYVASLSVIFGMIELSNSKSTWYSSTCCKEWLTAHEAALWRTILCTPINRHSVVFPDLMKRNLSYEFHGKFYGIGHRIPDLEQWFHKSESITSAGNQQQVGIFSEAFYHRFWEPQFVANSAIPFHNETFLYRFANHHQLVKTHFLKNVKIGYHIEFVAHTVNCSYTGLVGTKIFSPVYKKSGSISEYQTHSGHFYSKNFFFSKFQIINFCRCTSCAYPTTHFLYWTMYSMFTAGSKKPIQNQNLRLENWVKNRAVEFLRNFNDIWTKSIRNRRRNAAD